jgi:hypothetical protein
MTLKLSTRRAGLLAALVTGVALLQGCATPPQDTRFVYAPGKSCLVFSIGEARIGARNPLAALAMAARGPAVEIASTGIQPTIRFAWNPKYAFDQGTPFKEEGASGVVKVYFVEPGQYQFSKFGIFFSSGPMMTSPPRTRFPEFAAEPGRCTYLGRVTIQPSDNELVWSTAAAADMAAIRPTLPAEMRDKEPVQAPQIVIPKMVWP